MANILTVSRLDATIRAAGIPIDGVSSDGTIAFQASATPAQRTQGAAIVAAFDSSDAATATYLAQQEKAQASASIDRGALQSGVSLERLVRALALVVLDEVNTLRTAASLAPRTTVQLINAIKAKIAATGE